MTDDEYQTKFDALVAEIKRLEEQAGIGAATIKAREGTRSVSHAFADPPGDPVEEEWQRQEDDEDRYASTCGRLRGAYFGAPDPAQRKRLIAKQRELTHFRGQWMQIGLDEARRNLESIRNRPAEGWWIAAIVGATIVIIGYAIFSIAGALAAAVAGLFVGSGIEQNARRRREHAVAAAADEVKVAAQRVAKARAREDMFSAVEQETGEPDHSLGTAQ